MSPENKTLIKKKKLKMEKKKNRRDEIEGASNFDFDSTQQETLGKKAKKNEEKSELDSKKKKKKKNRKRDKSTESKEDLGIMMEERKTLDKTMMKTKKSDLGLKNKNKKKKGSEVDSNDVDRVAHEDLDGEHKRPAKEKKSKLDLKKKRRREIENDVDASNEGLLHADEHAAGGRPKSDHAKSANQFVTLKESGNSEKPTKASNGTKIKTKWLIKYKESRPGLNILQERIDDSITAYEEQQEQERKEREARAAVGGWTVVVHHKGRKKTTEAETGVTVGSVAQAVVVDKMGKKKNKEVFFRFLQV